MLAVVLTLGAMPMYGTFASAGTDEPTVETTDETPTSSVEPTTPEPAPAPQGEPEETSTPSAEVMPSQESEASPTPVETPTESPEPSESAPATYENSISGTLWLDMFDDIGNSIYAGDGTRQVEESPLAGYKISLFKADDLSSAVASTKTGADGKYSFENIEPGSYVVGVKTTTMDGVEYLLPLFWLDGTTGDNRFVATYNASADTYLYAYTAPITVAEDSEITGMDAGMRTVPQAQTLAGPYDAEIDLATGTVTGDSTGITVTAALVTFATGTENKNYRIYGTTTARRVVVNTGITTNITLDGASITIASQSPMRLEGTANVDLTLEGTNVLNCTSTSTTSAYAGLFVNTDATLTIVGTGSLNATGGFAGAGIGGAGTNNGTVVITSGTIIATGGQSGAGIGGARSGGGTIIINGGTVTAKGGLQGAGIGGGGGMSPGGSGGNITINGGTVTATGGSTAAGIGGGGGAGGTGPGTGGSGGTITINGGIIIATTSSTGAGIGGGGAGGTGTLTGGSGGIITITGGTVTATGGQRSSGIGGAGVAGTGSIAGSAGTITITGGRVTATGGSRGTITGEPYAGGIGGAVGNNGLTQYTTGTIIFTGGSIYPSRNNGVVGDNAVLPSPTNGSINGAPDTVHMVQFSGYSDNDPFYIVAGGTKQSYDYYGNAHPDGIVYPWLIYPGVLTKDATNITTTTADLHGDVYLVGNGYTITSGYFQVTTTSGDYTSPVKTETITPTSTSTSGVIDSYSAGTTGLSSGTTYYYRFVIVTGGVTIYGNEVMFKTPCLVTENYLKIGDGSALQTAAISNVENGGSFTGTPPTTLTASGDTYTYIGYRLGSTTATLNSGTPSAITISADTNIYYYYAGPPIVTVSHTGASGTTATLNGTYDLNGGTFTSGYFEIYDTTTSSWITLTSTSTISITSATGVTASTGQVDNSTTTPSITISGLTPGTTYQYRFTVTTNCGSDTATGSFTAGFAVTEKFVTLSGSTVDSTGLPDNVVNVASSYTASVIPTSHITGGNTYTYLGYKLDSYTTGDALTSGTPSSVTITGNRDVYYVYAIAEGSIKIEKYAHDGTTLLSGAEFKLEKLTGQGGSVTSIVGSMTTGAGGNVTFANLSAGSYRITETKAPTGYELLTAAFEVDIPKDIIYAVGTPPADNSYLYSTTSGGNITYHYYDVTYKVSDQASIVMPSAGATNTLPPYALWGGGIILLAALGGSILWLKRRRAYAPKHG